MTGLKRSRRKVIRFYRGARRRPQWNLGDRPGHPRPQGRGRWRGPAGLTVAGLTLAIAILPSLGDGLVGLFNRQDGCRVVMIVDGDTVHLHCPGRGFQPARIIGFDTPELKARCASEFVNALAAKQYLRWQIWSASDVSVVREGTDRYDRGLVRLFVDGTSVVPIMISSGLARPYDGGQRSNWCGEELKNMGETDV